MYTMKNIERVPRVFFDELMMGGIEKRVQQPKDVANQIKESIQPKDLQKIADSLSSTRIWNEINAGEQLKTWWIWERTSNRVENPALTKAQSIIDAMSQRFNNPSMPITALDKGNILRAMNGLPDNLPVTIPNTLALKLWIRTQWNTPVPLWVIKKSL